MDLEDHVEVADEALQAFRQPNCSQLPQHGSSHTHNDIPNVTNGIGLIPRKISKQTQWQAPTLTSQFLRAAITCDLTRVDKVHHYDTR